VKNYAQGTLAFPGRLAARRHGRLRSVDGSDGFRGSGSGDRIGHGNQTENGGGTGRLRRSLHCSRHSGRDYGSDRGDHRDPEGGQPHQTVHLATSRARTRAQIATAVAAICVLVFFLLCAVSQARVYGERPPGGGFVENPDGTWSLYTEGRDLPDEVFTDSEYKSLGRSISAAEVDAGTTGETGGIVNGVTGAEQVTGRQLEERLATGELYKTVGEKAVGEGLWDTAVTDGLAPSATETLMGAVSDLALAGGAAYVGIKIGNGIDEILGLPEWNPLDLFGETDTSSSKLIETIYSWLPGAKFGNVSTVRECATYYAEHGLGIAPHPSFICRSAQAHDKTKEVWYKGESNVVEAEYNTISSWFTSQSGTSARCGYKNAPMLTCVPYELGSKWMLIEVNPHKDGKVKELDFPAKGIDHLPQWDKEVTEKEEEEPAKKEKKKHLVPRTPKEVPLPVPQEVITTVCPDCYPGIENPSGEPVPKPDWPELPAPEKSEVGTDYKSRLESDGFTDVEIHVVPETSADPTVGPNEVIRVRPDPGSHYDPSTKVDVYVNPGDVPVPEPAPKIPSITIGGITEPELNPPHLNLLCENFPFGVPCWLVEELNSWSAVGEAPTLGISSFTIKGHKIDAGSINLSHLEPVMEKVRPFMIVFGTVGLVLLFYGFATGGNPGSGSGGGASNEEHEED
jgi:hypothetical protein